MSYLRTFVLLKHANGSGPGNGRLAGVGAVMPSGHVVVEWANETGGIAVFPSVELLLAAQRDRTAVIRWGTWEDDD